MSDRFSWNVIDNLDLNKLVTENIVAAFDEAFKNFDSFDTFFNLTPEGMRLSIFNEAFHYVLPWSVISFSPYKQDGSTVYGESESVDWKEALLIAFEEGARQMCDLLSQECEDNHWPLPPWLVEMRRALNAPTAA